MPDLAPYFLVRVGGMPLDILRRLDTPAADEALDAILDCEAALASRAAELSDRLFHLVPTLESAEARRRVLAARRTLASVEKVARLVPEEVADVVPDGILSAMRDIAAASVRRSALHCAFRSLFEAERLRMRTELKHLVRDENLQKGVLASNPVLFEHLERYAARADVDPAPAARDQRLEQTLLSYVARTATKTSPFSTFTLTGWGTWTPGETPVLELPGAQTSSKVRLNRTALCRVVEAIRSNPELRLHLLVGMNRTARLVESTWRIYRQELVTAPPHGGWITARESLATLPDNPTMAAISRICAGRTLTLAGLLDALTGVGTPERERAVRYVDELVRRQLLTLDLPFHELDLDFEPRLAAWLRGTSTTIGDEVARLLEETLAGLAELARSPASLRGEFAAGAAASFRAAEASLGLKSFQDPLFFEDALLDVPRLSLSGRHADCSVGDLATFAHASSVFDPLHLKRQRIARFRQTRWAPEDEVDLLTFFEAFVCEHPFGRADEADLAGAAPEIYAYQEQLKRHVRQTLRRDHDGCVIDAAAVRAFLRERPAGVELPRSATFFMQKERAADAPWKINLPVEGYGKFFSRFAFLFEEESNTGELREELRRWTPSPCEEDEVLADLGGVFGTNVNLHGVHVEHVLGYPGTGAPPAAATVLDLRDLLVAVDNHGLPRLRCRRTGRRVSPFHFGFLVKTWLPDLARFILEFEPSKAKPIPWHELIYGTGDLPPQTDRIFFGSLLIYRKQWHVPATDLPLRCGLPLESDSDYFKRVARWRRELGLPAEVFVTIDHRVLPPGQSREANAHASEKFTRKPQFINFRSPLFLPRLEKIFNVCLRRVSFEEVYPGGDCPLVQHRGRSYVSEVVAELRMDRQDGTVAETRTWSGAEHG